MADCPDKTDENDCEQLVLPPDYRGEKFPIQNSGEPIGLFVNMSILAFHDIETLQSTYLVDFVLSMRWVDPRCLLLEFTISGCYEEHVDT